MKSPIHIGTSGWHYAHWQGTFYPADTQPADFLAYYKQQFRTVEINNSFYHLPEKKTFKAWRDGTPADFIFAVKASRYITHMKKLSDPKPSVRKFFSRVEALGGKCGPILFQLPPRWHANAERLDDFLNALPSGHRYAFEFRDETWFSSAINEILEKYNAAFCIHDLAGVTSPLTVTADFVYLRFHGPDGPYQGSYSAKQLKYWANAIRQWRREGRAVYCYFDNDEQGFAPKNALALKKMV